MTDHLIIELTSDGGHFVAAGLVSDTGSWLRSIRAEAISEQRDTYSSVSIVLEGTEAPSYSVDVPPLSTAKLLKIIPNLMADKIAAHGDGVHFALLEQPQEGRVVVGVVRKEVIENALAVCTGLGVTPTRLIADYMALPAQDMPVVLMREETACVRYPEGHGCTLEHALADTLLAEGQGAPQKKVTTEKWEACLSAVPFLSSNFLQGPFAVSQSWGTYFILLKRAAFLAVCLGVVWTAHMLWSASSDYKRAGQFETETEALFLAAFPDVKRIVNMEAQARIAARQATGAQQGVFLSASTDLFRVLEVLPGVFIETIRFDETQGVFAATLSFSGFSEAEKFRAAMERANLAFSEGSSRQEQNRILTDIVISGGVGAVS